MKKVVYAPFGIKPIIKKRNVTSYCVILFAVDTSNVSKMHYLLLGHSGSYQKQHVIPHPPYFSLFPRLKMKLRGQHFDTIEVIEAESRAVLNTLKEHEFPDALKKNMAAPVPEIMDDS
jgi:hypothetical protein